MRALLLILLLLAPVWAERTPAATAKAFYAVGVSSSKLKGNARWEAVRPLMTPAFYELCRNGVRGPGSYTLKTQGIWLFDMNMFTAAQWGFAAYKVGTPYREGKFTIVPVRLSRPDGRGQDNEKVELLMIRSSDEYRIDDVRTFSQAKPVSKRAVAKADYQRFLEHKE